MISQEDLFFPQNDYQLALSDVDFDFETAQLVGDVGYFLMHTTLENFLDPMGAFKKNDGKIILGIKKNRIHADEAVPLSLQLLKTLEPDLKVEDNLITFTKRGIPVQLHLIDPLPECLQFLQPGLFLVSSLWYSARLGEYWVWDKKYFAKHAKGKRVVTSD